MIQRTITVKDIAKYTLCGCAMLRDDDGCVTGLLTLSPVKCNNVWFV